MVILDGLIFGFFFGCFYNGKYYRFGEIMYFSMEGDCERIILCIEYGLVFGDFRGCFMCMFFFLYFYKIILNLIFL